jgi:hypothetical protein
LIQLDFRFTAFFIAIVIITAASIIFSSLQRQEFLAVPTNKDGSLESSNTLGDPVENNLLLRRGVFAVLGSEEIRKGFSN